MFAFLGFLPFAGDLHATNSTARSAAELVESGHYKEARTAVSGRLKQSPRDAEALFLQSRLKQLWGDNAGATADIRSALAIDGTKADYHAQLANCLGEQAQHAGMFSGLGLARSARKEAEAALAIDQSNVLALEFMIQFYDEAPGIVGGDKKKADALVQKLIAIKPSHGYAVAAARALSAKDVGRAQSLLEDGARIQPQSYEIYSALASLYLSQLKRPADAERTARKAVKLDPSLAAAYTVLTELYARQQRWADLDNTISEAVRNAPQDLSPEYHAARVLITDKHDPARAEKYLRDYLAHEPEGGAPPLYAAHWRLGLTLEQEGRKGDAYSELQIAANMKPDFKPAQDDLKRVK